MFELIQNLLDSNALESGKMKLSLNIIKLVIMPENSPPRCRRFIA